MISASITALTRILYEFRAQLPERVLEDLVSTMDLFLESNNREIVRSVLGFVKVAVISLPERIMRPRLRTLVPGLLGWSREHKARFRAKVKHVFERLMRRFGAEVVEEFTPEADRRFVVNVRKGRERRRRRKEGAADGDGEEGVGRERRRGRFESEFDQAVYGSASEESGSDGGSVAGGDSEDEVGARGGKRGGGTYIVEDEDEPLDLLDRKALGNISSTKPVKFRTAPANGKARTKAKMDMDGKLVFGGDEADVDAHAHAEMMDLGNGEPGDSSLQGGINAYVEAIRGRDSVQRGRGGRLKFSNRKEKAGGMEMEVDVEEVGKGLKAKRGEVGRGGKEVLKKRAGHGSAGGRVERGRVGKMVGRGGGRDAGRGGGGRAGSGGIRRGGRGGRR